MRACWTTAGKAKPAVQTISAYIDALLESYIFYEVKRFDIKGKDYLRTLGKYYIVDPGLRTYLLGNRGGDVGHILENIVYLELLRRGYEVAIGKVGDKGDRLHRNEDEREKVYPSHRQHERPRNPRTGACAAASCAGQLRKDRDCHGLRPHPATWTVSKSSKALDFLLSET